MKKLTLDDKLVSINAQLPIVPFDEDLDLIKDVTERKIKQYKRIVQDCQATIESEGPVARYVTEFNNYVEDLYALLQKRGRGEMLVEVKKLMEELKSTEAELKGITSRVLALDPHFNGDLLLAWKNINNSIAQVYEARVSLYQQTKN